MAPLKVLLVDDLPGNLLALESILKHPEVEIHKAESGVEALELLLRNQYAVAVVDVQMPDMDGFELAELMRGSQKTRSIPIIFVTAGAHSKVNIFRGYESGAVDFLYKPLDPHVVRSKVQVFLDLYRKGRLIQAQLLETQKALAERDVALKEAQDALQSRDEFLSIASHELKTPLTGLLLQLQMMARQVRHVQSVAGGELSTSAGRMGRAVDVSLQQSRKLSSLIDELLDLTRIRLGKLTLNKEEVDLRRLAADSLSRLRLTVQQTPQIELDCPSSIMGRWDPLRIEQVITNLLSNAVKYGEGSPVALKVERRGESVRIRVSDQGLGIAPEMQEKIFQRFERAEAVNHFSGLGLGLYITRQIVEAHGGSIWVESELNRGSTFVVDLPLRHEPALAAGQ
jgi:signal transduction histidine kinase